VSASKRIHISYSDRHFSPYQEKNDKFWYSCSQIASHLWKCLSETYSNVTYGDVLPESGVDLLWTNRDIPWRNKASKTIYFASIAHAGFIHSVFKQNRSFATSKSPHGMATFFKRLGYLKNIYYSDALVVIGNEAIGETFTKHSPGCKKKLKVIDCGVDYSHYKCPANKAGQKTFVYAATQFSVRKGSHILAEAWPSFARQNRDCRIILLGKNGDYDLKSRMAGQPNVECIGEYKSGSDEYISLLGKANWSILPSMAEGQAGTLLESMSCGCIPIASKHSGVDAGKYGGYLLEPNTAENLISKMNNAVNEWTGDQHAQVRSKVEQYHSWSLFQDKVLEISEKVLSNTLY